MPAYYRAVHVTVSTKFEFIALNSRNITIFCRCCLLAFQRNIC